MPANWTPPPTKELTEEDIRQTVREEVLAALEYWEMCRRLNLPSPTRRLIL